MTARVGQAYETKEIKEGQIWFYKSGEYAETYDVIHIIGDKCWVHKREINMDIVVNLSLFRNPDMKLIN